MALRKTAEEKHAGKAAKEDSKRQKAFDKAWQQFWWSPAGQARQAFDAGDHVFQYSLDVMDQSAIIVAMIGSASRRKNVVDPTTVLNSVCREGWEIVNGDFVFVTQGHQSRDKFHGLGAEHGCQGDSDGLLPVQTQRREPRGRNGRGSPPAPMGANRQRPVTASE